MFCSFEGNLQRYPVWIAPKLQGVTENDRIQLTQLLREISAKKRDFHSNSPVKGTFHYLL